MFLREIFNSQRHTKKYFELVENPGQPGFLLGYNKLMTFQLIPQAYAAERPAEVWESFGCANADGVVTIKGVECLFRNLISPVPALLALVAVGMIVFAGIRLITAGSDPKATAAAWNTFTWAVIGLILLSVAWLILILIKNFTGADVTTFTIGI